MATDRIRRQVRSRKNAHIESLEIRTLLSIASVSLRVDGTDTGNVGATFSQQSADGRYVVFRSASTNLVSGVNDVNGYNSDIFCRDRLTGKTELVSVSRLGINRTPDHPSFNAYISANGRFVVFESDATDLVANDTNFVSDFEPGRDVFVRDMYKKTTILVSGNRFGFTTVRANNLIRESDQTDGRLISDDGRYVVFQSDASDLVQGDNNFDRDVFVRDTVGQKTYLVNVNSAGQTGEGPSDHGVLSADGRFVAFESRARNLIPNDQNFNTKIFRHDLRTGATVLVSNNDLQSGFLESGGSLLPKISADGQVVVFESFRRLSTADANDADRDVYVRDMRKSKPDLVSISSNGGPANSTSFAPNISDDGRYVVFESLASNLTTTDKDPATYDALLDLDNKDVFRRNLVAGTTELVSFDYQNTKSALGESREIKVSGDGRFVAWESQSRQLTQDFHEWNDQVYDFDIFRRDMVTGKTSLVSGRRGSATESSNDGVRFPVISRDGRYVSFHSTSDDLIGRDTNSGNGGRQTDVFISGSRYTIPPKGGTGNDVFVLTYSGTLAAGSVAVTVSLSGGTVKSLGNFSVETPLTIFGGGGTDSVRIVGTSGNDSFSVASTGLIVRGGVLILDSIESRAIAGGGGNDTYRFDADASLGVFKLDESGGGIDTIDLSQTTTSSVKVNISLAATQVVNSKLSLNLGSASTFEIVIGGAGNDILTGNSLANVLIGNSGNDSLIGGSGRDILIGGYGLDQISGGNDDDILIAGRTTSDANLPKLLDLRAQWTSANSYPARITNIRAGVGASKASLKAKVSVLNDTGSDDSLTGGAGRDWFFRALDDVMKDFVTGETADLL